MKTFVCCLAIILVISPSVLIAQTPAPIVIRVGTLIDGKGGVLRNTNIVVQGSRIVRIDPNAGNPTYDLSRLTVMPGWIDAHLHLGQHFDLNNKPHSQQAGETPQQIMLHMVDNAYNLLMAGFTTVQSVGDANDKELREWIRARGLPGPRILTSLQSIGRNAGTPEQVRELVRQRKAAGADLIKVFAAGSIRDGGPLAMSQEQVDAACSEAKAQGMRAIVHAGGADAAAAAAKAGCTSVEHGYRLTDETIQMMVDKGIYLNPSFSLMIATYREHKDLYLGQGNYTPEGFAEMDRAAVAGAESMKRALAKGVKVIYGTDAVPGGIGKNYEDFIYHVKDGGQTPMDAIISATSRAAESMNLGNQIGTIAPGFEADLVATEGNPLDDITNVRKVVFVMKGGKVYRNWR